MIFLGAAILVSGAVAPVITSAVGGLAGYRVMGLAIAAVLAVAMLATFTGTRRAPRLGHEEAEQSLCAQLAVIRGKDRRLAALLQLRADARGGSLAGRCALLRDLLAG